ncbi:hypothetical protein [Georgenia sp. SYP-B2076]|uniref:hypothetical protein n=1 Tax=Georgenia sp. SYP-B2076 TaxID=2495881 RepID=UPI000F8CA213
MRRPNIDLVGRRVVVESQIQNLRGQGKVVRGVKTEAGARIVHLPASVTRVLQTHMGAFSQAGADGLVFPSRVGTPISQSVLYKVWDEARRAIGRPDLRIHGLRDRGDPGRTDRGDDRGAAGTPGAHHPARGHEVPGSGSGAGGSHGRRAGRLQLSAGRPDGTEEEAARPDASNNPISKATNGKRST